MPLITWNAQLSVGIGELDRQHQKLVSLINDLNEAMLKGQGKDRLGSVLGELMAYAGTHFATEERYFDRYAYPERAAHQREHAQFVAKAQAFQRDFAAGKLGLSVEVMRFLSDWLQSHITGTDKKYGPFLNAKGVV